MATQKHEDIVPSHVKFYLLFFGKSRSSWNFWQFCALELVLDIVNHWSDARCRRISLDNHQLCDVSGCRVLLCQILAVALTLELVDFRSREQAGIA